ncbi:hypothetical protein PVK06_020346 [Gossypium arboreum]|uniref:Uncharacterized protein n=1 Tax=Gossypium arboreum TaxID=29729 RepID=A0ABR0PMK3_GOSAR|nr:hypothetical protein PVK06_020346 [Gossypium arboreum]
MENELNVRNDSTLKSVTPIPIWLSSTGCLGSAKVCMKLPKGVSWPNRCLGNSKGPPICIGCTWNLEGGLNLAVHALALNVPHTCMCAVHGRCISQYSLTLHNELKRAKFKLKRAELSSSELMGAKWRMGSWRGAEIGLQKGARSLQGIVLSSSNVMNLVVIPNAQHQYG